MAHTIQIDVIDKSIPIGNNREIAVIHQPNPCYGYAATAKEIRDLIQMPIYFIYEAGTQNIINGRNFYTYFPEEQPGGGGGGGGVTPEQVAAMITNSIDATVSATSENAVQNKVIKQYVDDSVEDKVDKVEGKGLSTNDYTTVEKTKLEDLVDIQSIGEGLSLDNGELSASGGTEYAAGQGIAFSPIGFNPDPEYYFTSKVECKLGGRTFTKYNEEPAVAFVFTNSNDFSGPIYLGHTEDSVKFTQDYNYSVSDPDGSFEYQGYTWYYSHLGFFMPGSYTDSLGNLKKFTAYQPSEARMLDMYKAMIDLARAVPSDDKAISAKLGEGLSFDDNDAIKVEGLSELVAKVQKNENNISMLTENGGGINKFQVTATTATINGITFTVNADKTITATGSIADSTQGNAIFTLGAYTAVSGDVLSEGFTEANSKAYVYARGGSTNLATVPYKEILTGDIGVQRNYACVITADTVGQVNITFKPMICDSDSYAKSGVYQPHALSNFELTAKEQQNENNILSIEKANGRKNIIPNRGALVDRTLTYTWSADGSITVSGTKTSDTANFVTALDFTPYSDLGLVAGQKLMAVNTGTYVCVSLVYRKNSTISSATTIFETTEITLPSEYDEISIRIQTRASATTLNETIRPMLCDKALYDIDRTITPHSMSNTELTPTTQVIQHNFSAANTLEKTSLSYAVGVGTYLISCSISWDSGEPLALILSSGTDVASVTRYTTYAGIEVESGQAQTLQTISALVNAARTPVTLNVFAKNSSATGRSNITLSAQKLR